MYIIKIVQKDSPLRKRSRPGVRDQDGRKEEAPMTKVKGIWYYQGKAYANLHDALTANWPR